MDEVYQIALWIGGVFLMIISGLLGWIAFMLKSDKDTIVFRLEKHEGWIIKQQEEIHEMSEKTSVAIELIKQEQKQGQERLRIFREEFFEHKSRGKKRR